MTRFVLLVAAAVLLVTASAAAAAPRSTVTVRSSAYGKILFDGGGRALYAFTKDPRRKSVCAGACAKAWPPYVVTTRPKAGAGVSAPLVGTTKRADGRTQVTYNGRPLYTYHGDTPTKILCNGVDGWFVVRAH